MEAKDKAIELINKYLQLYDGRVNIAIKGALLCVDTILYDMEIRLGLDREDFGYWQDVKTEIENYGTNK